MRFNSPLLLVLLFLSFPSFGLTLDDLVKRDGLYYEKFTDVPFSGEIDEGLGRGELKDGKREGPWVNYYDDGQLDNKGVYENGRKEGPWVSYWSNGQLSYKGVFKNGRKEGPWVSYNKDGNAYKEGTGTFKDGVKIGD